MSKTLYILRGVCGAGKTSFADMLSRATKASWYETDMWFTDKEGNYTWDATKVTYYHKLCLEGISVSMSFNLDVIVSNTFTTEKELQPYLDLAKDNNYKVISLIVENRCETENIHKVDLKTIKKMVDRFSVKLISDKTKEEIKSC